MSDKTYILLSDLHLGCGDDLDDFLYGYKGDPSQKQTCFRSMEGKFSSFLEGVKTIGEAVELILLGDIFDLLQVTKGQGTEKLNAIYFAHKKFFEDLGKFADTNRVVYVAGNHDAEMFDPPMAEWLRGRVPNIIYAENGLPFLYYETPNIYCEHGNQLEGPPGRNIIKRIHRDFAVEPFKRNDHPPGSRFVIDVVNDMEREYPDVDNIMGDKSAAIVYYIIQEKSRDVFSAFLDKLRSMRTLEVSAGGSYDEVGDLLTLIAGVSSSEATDSVAAQLRGLLNSYVGVEKGIQTAEARDIIQGIFSLLKDNMHWLLGQLQRWIERVDSKAKSIVDDPACKCKLIRQPAYCMKFLILGHTHRATKILSEDQKRMYLNCGTWRHFYEPNTREYSQTLNYVVVRETEAQLSRFE